MLPVPMKGRGDGLRRQLSVATRRELIEAVAVRYRAAGRNGKKEILDEFVKVTGFHRKHAIRALKQSLKQEKREPRERGRIYDEAVRQALTIIWEAADRICGKRLRQVIAGLIDAMERHGHLRLDAPRRAVGGLRGGLAPENDREHSHRSKAAATPLRLNGFATRWRFAGPLVGGRHRGSPAVGRQRQLALR